ncbi:hypothetical protein BJ973_009275 [Actinoplanes tereljensis]|uniref:Uncharacterized protein n=1 Tax=Paractinoplanes tereljensis TaxID=571912 RepID=A0A919NGJ8_9ACTN|nr:hypothetical protein [Actinoplanes tereljensis]GIF17760.1 hypothetical protein Ate02nite_04900 [Actinoplanes tereljensis]
MTIEDDDRTGDDGVRGAVPERSSSRRRNQVAAAVAGFAILGAGAYAITASIAGNDRTTAQDVGAVVPAPAVTTAAPSADVEGQADSVTPASPSESAPASSAAPGPAAPAPRKSTAEPATTEEIKQAREKAAKDGHPLQRPPVEKPHVAAMSGPVDTRSVPRKDGSLRITSARYDLTGQRELLWVADQGKPVGDGINCSQKFKFSNNSEAAVRPNMMVCWLTSPAKSVVTVLVDQGGKPTAAESVEAIKAEWAKLG